MSMLIYLKRAVRLISNLKNKRQTQRRRRECTVNRADNVLEIGYGELMWSRRKTYSEQVSIAVKIYSW